MRVIFNKTIAFSSIKLTLKAIVYIKFIILMGAYICLQLLLLQKESQYL